MSDTIYGIFAVALTLVGLSYFLRARAWAALYIEIEMHPQRFLPVGLLMFCAGLYLALTVNDWSSTWPIFVTAFGWLFALEGAVLTLRPSWIGSFAGRLGSFLVRYLQLGGLLVVGLGLLLCWEYLLQHHF